MTRTTDTKTKTFRPEYPDAEEVRYLRRVLEDGTYTMNDLERALEVLRKAGIRHDKVVVSTR